MQPDEQHDIDPGIYSDITNADYHAGPGLSSSGVKLAHKSMLHYRHQYIDGHRKEATPAMNLGSLSHGLVLENGKVREDFLIVEDAKTRSVKTYKDAATEHADSGLTLMLESELETATHIADAVLNHDKAAALLNGSKNEHSLFWDDDGRLCKCRPDAWRPDISVVADLKTAASAAPDDFQRSIIKFGYDVSAAWYLRGIEAVTGERPRTWAWIVVETSAPYAVQIYTADQMLIERGERICNEALARLDECERTDKWPAYSDHILPITCPAWAI